MACPFWRFFFQFQGLPLNPRLNYFRRTMNGPRPEGYKEDVTFYIGTPLPGGKRPLVLIASQLHPENREPGLQRSETRIAQFFVLVPEAATFGREIAVEQGYLDNAGGSIVEALPMKAVEEAALSRAQVHLDGLALTQPHASQPVVLAWLSDDQVASLALATEYAAGWQYVLDHTRNGKVKTMFKRFKDMASQCPFTFEEPADVNYPRRFSMG